MKPFALLVLTCTLAAAQVDSQKLLIQVGAQAMESLKSIPENDKAAILASTSELLKKHVTFRPGGTASAYCIPNAKQWVEWKNLNVRGIKARALTDADRLNGVTKSYFVPMDCDAHRSWNPKTNAWSEWKPGRGVLFPSGIQVELKDGKWHAIESTQLKNFIPGPGTPTTTSQRGTQDAQLPAGMTRGK
jgi:hypothetical protein